MNAPQAVQQQTMTSNVLRLSHQPEAVRVARRRVRSELAEFSLPEAVLDDVEVVVSELLSNAVRYARPIAGGVLLVGWRLDTAEVQVRVTDGGSGRRVELRETSPMSDSGRGLHIVERLSHAWGVTDHVGGLRTVWAAIPLEQRGPSLRLVR